MLIATKVFGLRGTMATFQWALEQKLAAKLGDVNELRLKSGQKRELHCFCPAETLTTSGSDGAIFVEITFFDRTTCPECVKRLIRIAVEEGVHAVLPESPVICAITTQSIGPGVILE